MKKDLKSFVRYDGNGRIIPSSVILARKIPKVGRWIEVDAYECCGSTTTSTTTTSTTTTAIPAPENVCVISFNIANQGYNGTYVIDGLINGKYSYVLDAGHLIVWNNVSLRWEITTPMPAVITAWSYEDVPYPNLVDVWGSVLVFGDVFYVNTGICV